MKQISATSNFTHRFKAIPFAVLSLQIWYVCCLNVSARFAVCVYSFFFDVLMLLGLAPYC